MILHITKQNAASDGESRRESGIQPLSVISGTAIENQEYSLSAISGTVIALEFQIYSTCGISYEPTPTLTKQNAASGESRIQPLSAISGTAIALEFQIYSTCGISYDSSP